MSSLTELYHSVIVEHDRSPRNYRSLAAPSGRAEARNPLCGDEVSVEVQVDDGGRITDIGFLGRGCAISRASASLMTTIVRGKTITEARELFTRFHALVTGAPVDAADLGKLAAFGGVAEFPMRVKCATLAWHTMREAVAAAGRPGAMLPGARSDTTG